MRRYGAELVATRELRDDLDVVVDVLWATNAAEFYVLISTTWAGTRS